MTTWFIRLGSTRYTIEKKLYQALAREHSIIKIGYCIGEDLTKKNEIELKNHLKNKGANSKVISLINMFVNGIVINDEIISPSWENPKKYKVGKVIKECGTLKSFFKGREKELNGFLKSYPGDKEQGSQKIKPAIKVKWESKDKNLNDFSPKLQNELTKSMPATVNRLKL